VRSPFGALLNRAQTISQAPPGSFGRGWYGTSRSNNEAHMRTMSTSGTVFSLVNRSSTAVASPEWHLYRKAASGLKKDRVEIFSHAALDLWNKPNRFFSRARLMEAGQQHCELTGETSIFVAYDDRLPGVPMELWPVRPDRVAPVPDPQEFLAGYVYQTPSGAVVPLGLHQMLQILMPNPEDPYRGLGAIQAVMPDIKAGRYSAEWNMNFFLNGAEPGGIIEIAKRMSPADFKEFRERWNDGHKGVANAHRVAILTEGKWVDRKYTNRDMQFTELRTVSRDTILEAFGYPKSMLGIVEDVNRANAQSGEYVFAKWLTVPRLDRWKGFLNTGLLPLFGATGKGLEFDYDSPVPEDEAAENAERTSKAGAFKTLCDAGVDPVDAAEIVGLPPMRMLTAPAPDPAAPVDVAATVRKAVRAELAVVNPRTAAPCTHAIRNVDETDIPEPPDGVPAEDVDVVEEVDLSSMQEAFLAALAALVAAWVADIVAGWTGQLLAAIREVLAGADASELAYLSVDTADATAQLLAAMTELAASAADDVVAEAAAQDVTAEPVTPEQDALLAVAATVAALEGQRYALAAGREAARLAGGELSDDEIVGYVALALGVLAVSTIAAALGGALTAAQAMARLATLLAAPLSDLYASEVNDLATCLPCRAIHGKWLGRSSDMKTVRRLYPDRGYVNCEGRDRCRGQVVGIWRYTREGAA
jgi:HK97 family phage portal protein